MTTPVLDPAEVQIGTSNGPGIYVAPEGTPPPADTSSDWAAPWLSLGYLSDDGPTISGSTDTEDIQPWQSRAPIRTVVTGRTMTVQFIMWQLNETTLALRFDADVPTPAADGSVSMQIRTDEDQHLYAIGIDTADGGRALRLIFHRASLSDSGDMQIQAGAAVPLDVTLSALDDAGVLADVLLGPAAAAPASDAAAASTTSSVGTSSSGSSPSSTK
jgi:hypothetical protein